MIMRQIKFRAKTTANGHWVYGNLIDRGNDVVSIRNSKSEPWVDPSTVGQFTGLLDHNSKEIYEGDIIRSPLNNEVVVKYGYKEHIVRHNDFVDSFAAYGWIAKNIQNGITDFLDNDILQGEVIGNVFDNPELIPTDSDMTKNEFKKGDKVVATTYYDIDINGYSTTIPIGEEGVIEDVYDDELFVSFNNYGVSLIRPISEFEVITPLDRRTAFLTELRALLRKYDAELGDSGITRIEGMEITFGDNTPCISYKHCTLNADNIMDFDKEGV